MTRFNNNFAYYIRRLINGLFKILNTYDVSRSIEFCIYEYNIRMYTRIIGRLRLSSYDNFVLRVYFYIQSDACMLLIIFSPLCNCVRSIICNAKNTHYSAITCNLSYFKIFHLILINYFKSRYRQNLGILYV